MATKLDSLDYKILKMLSLNARKPYLEIARACNVSGAAIHQRIQKLYNMGVIKGSISLINPASVGYQTCAYIGFFECINDRYAAHCLFRAAEEKARRLGCDRLIGQV